MENILKEGFAQIPSLVVLVFLVIHFFRSLEKFRGTLEKIVEKQIESTKIWTEVVKENTQVISTVIEVIRKCEKK